MPAEDKTRHLEWFGRMHSTVRGQNKTIVTATTKVMLHVVWKMMRFDSRLYLWSNYKGVFRVICARMNSWWTRCIHPWVKLYREYWNAHVRIGRTGCCRTPAAEDNMIEKFSFQPNNFHWKRLVVALEKFRNKSKPRCIRSGWASHSVKFLQNKNATTAASKLCDGQAGLLKWRFQSGYPIELKRYKFLCKKIQVKKIDMPFIFLRCGLPIFQRSGSLN